MIRRILCIALILLVGISASVLGRSTEEEKPVEIDSTTGLPILKGRLDYPQGQTDRETMEQLRTARTLIAEGQFLSASALLELLIDKQPDNQIVLNLLKNCYDELEYHGKTEALMRKMLERRPNQFEYLVYLGQALAKQGKDKESDSVYQYARSLIPRTDGSRMADLIRTMVDGNSTGAALKLIDSLRADSGDSTLYAVERGKIFENLHQFDKAALEYLADASEPDMAAMNSRMYLNALLDYPESSEQAERALFGIKTQPAQGKALEILSQYYLKADRFNDAFNTALLLDSVAERDGRNFLFYMQACLDRKLYREAVKMGTYSLNRYPNSPMATQMYFHFGDALAALGLADSAIAAYQTIVNRTPVVSDKSEAMYRIGMTHLEVSHNYDRALLTFDTVLAKYREGMGWFKSQAKRPKVFLKQGKLAEAEQAYALAGGTRLDDEGNEEVEFYYAYTLFLEKQFDSSLAKLRKLQVDYPRGVYFNDAIGLILVFTDVQDNPDLIGRYAEAEYYRTIDRPDSTTSVLKEILTAEDTRLADLACYRLAESILAKNDTTGAIAYLEQGIQEFTESFYRPYMLKQLADIRSVQRGESETARQLYRQLLEKYPNHPYSKDARKRMKALENTV